MNSDEDDNDDHHDDAWPRWWRMMRVIRMIMMMIADDDDIDVNSNVFARCWLAFKYTNKRLGQSHMDFTYRINLQLIENLLYILGVTQDLLLVLNVQLRHITWLPLLLTACALQACATDLPVRAPFQHVLGSPTAVLKTTLSALQLKTFQHVDRPPEGTWLYPRRVLVNCD